MPQLYVTGHFLDHSGWLDSFPQDKAGLPCSSAPWGAVGRPVPHMHMLTHPPNAVYTNIARKELAEHSHIHVCRHLCVQTHRG